ncbi:MAG: hypothetical protein WBC93_15890 [Sulfitobacter sp.]
MSLLTIAEGLAKSVGLPIPDSVIGSTDRSWKEVAEHANAAGEELARRVDWGQLTASTTLTGDGSDLAHSLPSGISRLAKGVAVTSAGGTVRPLTQAEWASLASVEGVPRYFILREDILRLWPYLANAATVTVTYQTGNWCSNGTGAFTADDDTSLIDEELFLKALEVRWRRQKGMEFADQEAEYEAALQDYARNNDRSRL